MVSYLKSVKKQFLSYKDLGDRTFDQLNDEDLFWEFNDDNNSIVIIVKHMVGNMLSRWTNFLTEDGEKEWRHRDTEFEDPYTKKEEMLSAWEKGWQCLFNALNTLQPEDLERIVYIRNQEHTVVEAINRQLCHYAYHVGQLIYVAKMLKGSEWKSLSIPKNQSDAFNKLKFNT